jgi:hypothetical protein
MILAKLIVLLYKNELLNKQVVLKEDILGVNPGSQKRNLDRIANH